MENSLPKKKEFSSQKSEVQGQKSDLEKLPAESLWNMKAHWLEG